GMAMPGEIPAPSPEDTRRDSRIESELTQMQSGPVERDVALEMAHATDARLESAQAEEFSKYKPDKLYKKPGELRDTRQVRKARERIAAAGDAAGMEAGESFIRDRAEQQKGFIENVDRARLEAQAEAPGREQSANLKAAGLHELAADRLRDAKAASAEVG